MARLAASLALVLLLLAAFAYADGSVDAPSVAPATKSYFTAPVVALSPAMVEGTAMGPSAEESESDPDAGTAGSPGAVYPPVSDNAQALAPGAGSSSSSSSASVLGVSSAAAAAVSVAAVAGYFAF